MSDLSATELDERAAQIVESHNKMRDSGADDIAFATISPADAKVRLNTVDPFFGGFGWTMSAPPGGIITGRVLVNFLRPDAVPADSNIYVHVWVGSGNVDTELNSFLLNVDTRFPRLSEPRVPGLRPGTSQVPEIPVRPDTSLLSFRLHVPFDVERSVYLGNICLMRRAPFGIGDVLGRAAFAFRVRGLDEPPDVN